MPTGSSITFDFWRPILDTSQRARVHILLGELLSLIPDPSDQGDGIAGGSAGFALMYAHLSRSKEIAWNGDLDLVKKALAHLEAAVDGLPNLGNNPFLFGGYSGVAWVVDRLQELGVLEDATDFNEMVDDALIDYLRLYGPKIICELIYGVSGIGLYALDRGNKGRGKELRKAVIKILSESKETHEGTAGTVTWFYSADQLGLLHRQQHPNGCYNFGLSHGIPGAMAFLGECAAKGDLEASDLAERSLRWLISQRRSFPNGARFPYSCSPGESGQASRVAWCYGDLGVAVAMLKTARTLRRNDLWCEALDVALNCAQRPIDDSHVMDAGLCHGSFGNFHLFNRLWQGTGDSRFREAALAWFEHGWALRMPGEALGGFPVWRPAQPGEAPRSPYVQEAGILVGIAGVILALAAGSGGPEPSWDRFLLVDLDPLDTTPI